MPQAYASGYFFVASQMSLDQKVTVLHTAYVRDAELRLRADSICVHGDKPSAVAQACGVRDALLAEGFTLCPLPEVVGSRLEKNLRTVS